MIDIHSHILFGIDDGAKTLEESIVLLKKMKSIGVETILATPHYIHGTSYTANNKEKSVRLKKIKEILRQENLEIYVYLGNEVFIDSNIDLLINEEEISTLYSTQYILVEFPRNTEVIKLYEILFQLRTKGYIPIIAHPERYLFIQNDYEVINKFLEMGCLFQGNIENARRKYGKIPEKVFWYMLKNNKYQFLATDVHHANDSLFSNFSKMKDKIIKEIGEKEYKLLTEDNPIKVFKNERIDIGEITPIKNNWTLFKK